MLLIKLSAVLLLSITISRAHAQTNSDDASTKRHNEMMAVMMSRPKLPVKSIGILLYDGYNTMDAMGPYHTLASINGAKVFFVGRTKGAIVNQRKLKIQVDSSIDEVKHLDILVIPGGAKETFMATVDTPLLNWIREIDKSSIYTTSVCTGSWILGATGLLKGKNATSNWYRADEMMKFYGANFKEERWVKDGKYWTSAGVTAGMDMSLAIIDDLFGRRYTEAVMLDLEYNPQPPYNAGTPKKSEPFVADMMLEMYDMFMLPMIQKEKQKQPAKKPSLFQQWPALDEYHKLMSASFHPAEEGKLEPVKKNAYSMAVQAKKLKESAIPAEFNKAGIPGLLAKLEKESADLAKLIKSKKSDEEIKKAIFSLHDRFHEIVGLCRD